MKNIEAIVRRSSEGTAEEFDMRAAGTSNENRALHLFYVRQIRDQQTDEWGSMNQLPRLPEVLAKSPTQHDLLVVPLGHHRESAGEHSGKEKLFNVYPYSVKMSPSDIDNALYWASSHAELFPREDNYANAAVGLSGLIVRVEWGEDPMQPYEVDTEPAGFGMLPHISGNANQMIAELKQSWGKTLWATMGQERVADSVEHFGQPLVIADELGSKVVDVSGILLPFMKTSNGIPNVWRKRSILPVEHMEEKDYLVDLALARIVKHDDPSEIQYIEKLIENNQGFMIRPMLGSCATGLAIFAGDLRIDGKKPQGSVTATRARSFLSELQSSEQPFMIRDVIKPATLTSYGIPFEPTPDDTTFGNHDQMTAIKRIYVGFDGKGVAHVIGGMISARRRSLLVHGANDAITVILDVEEKSYEAIS